MNIAPSVSSAHHLPPQHFLFGNLKPFAADALGFLASINEVSPFTRFRIMKTPVYFISDAALVNDVLTNKSQAYVRNRSFARRLRHLFGSGLLTSEGEQWKRLRKLSAPAFQPRSTNTYIPIILEELECLMTEWHHTEEVDIAKAMSRVTARIITRCVFGMHLEVDMVEMEACMDELMASLGPRLRYPVYTPDWLPIGGNQIYRSAVNRLDRLIISTIRHRSKDPFTQNPSLLGDLVSASEQEGLISEAHLRDQIVTLFLAGHETTASTLAFCFILLTRYPEYCQRLQAEAMAADFSTFSSLQDIRDRMPITYNAVQETMRLYPAGYLFGRTVVSDTQLGDEALKPKSLVLISPYISHRNPAVFPDPERFDPDRWLNLQPSRSQYFPFSAGSRTCIGEYLAMLEACLVLAYISARYQVQCGTAPIQVQTGVTLRPVNNTAAQLQPL